MSGNNLLVSRKVKQYEVLQPNSTNFTREASSYLTDENPFKSEGLNYTSRLCTVMLCGETHFSIICPNFQNAILQEKTEYLHRIIRSRLL